MPDKLANIPAGVLSSLIVRTIFGISTEESRFTLSGALLLVKADRVVMVSTDGHRLALCEKVMDLSDVETGYRALVPKKAMSELLKLFQEMGPEGNVEFGADENHLFFRSGGRLLIARKLTGNFPDYERVLPTDQPHTVVLPGDEFRVAIERVSQFADERSHAVRLRFMPGELTLHSSLSDTGETEETLPVTYDGPKIEAGFNAHYIADFLRAVGEDKVSFKFRDAGSAGELCPAGGESGYNYRYVVMPMRI